MSASEYIAALNGRPSNFRSLDAGAKWAIDKSCGTLDWDGDCRHGKMINQCPECKTEWETKFGDQKVIK